MEDIAEPLRRTPFTDGMSQPEEPQDHDEYGEGREAIPPDENEVNEGVDGWPSTA